MFLTFFIIKGNNI